MAALAALKDYPVEQALRIRKVDFTAVTSGDTWAEAILNSVEFAFFLSAVAQTSTPIVAINAQTKVVTITLTESGSAGTLVLFGK
jgi:hypothetical protein